MFRSIPIVTLVACLSVFPPVRGDDDVAKAMGKIAALGPGVHAVKTDKQGRITSCIVVGQARISTVLGKPKGLQVARDKARLDATGRFATWLNEKVEVHEKSEEETILFLEGNQENDAAALKESGKAIEKTAKKIESVSQALVKGLQVLHTETTDADKTFTLVLGWDAKTAKAVSEVADPDAAPTKKPSGEPPVQPKKPVKIDDKSVTSPDAKKFLP